MGTANPSGSVCCHAELVVRGNGCHRARTGDQDTLSERQENSRVEKTGTWTEILGMRAVPSSPDGIDNAFDIEVGTKRPAEMVPRSSGKVLVGNTLARTYLRRADFEHWGLSEGCPGCWFPRTGQGRQQTHSEARRRRIESLLCGESSGFARLTKEPIVHLRMPLNDM